MSKNSIYLIYYMILNFNIKVIILFIIAILLLLNLIYKNNFTNTSTQDNTTIEKNIKKTIDSIYKIKMDNIRTLSNVSSKLLKGSVPSNLNVIGKINIIPAGYVMAYTGNTDIVQYVDFDNQQFIGWFICNGRSISKTKYSDLYNVIKDTFKNNNNSSLDNNPDNFNLPDYSGAFLRGNGSAFFNSKNNISARLNTYQDCALTQHTHNLIDNGHNHEIKFTHGFVRDKKNYFDRDGWDTIGGKTQTDVYWAFNPITTNITKPTDTDTTDVSLLGVKQLNSNQINIGNETRPYNWTINWIIKT